MKTAEPDSWNKDRPPHVAAPRALSWSALDAWHHLRPKEKAAGTTMPLTAEERYRAIELVVQRQANRRHLTPESFLRDWLDAEAEVSNQSD